MPGRPRQGQGGEAAADSQTFRPDRPRSPKSGKVRQLCFSAPRNPSRTSFSQAHQKRGGGLGLGGSLVAQEQTWLK